MAQEAVARARRGDGPTLIEAETYRFRGHSLADPDELRLKEEKEHYQARLCWGLAGSPSLRFSHAQEDDSCRADLVSARARQGYAPLLLCLVQVSQARSWQGGTSCGTRRGGVAYGGLRPVVSSGLTVL